MITADTVKDCTALFFSPWGLFRERFDADEHNIPTVFTDG